MIEKLDDIMNPNPIIIKKLNEVIDAVNLLESYKEDLYKNFGIYVQDVINKKESRIEPTSSCRKDDRTLMKTKWIKIPCTKCKGKGYFLKNDDTLNL